ncbi:MAG: hypothetical protein ACYDBO_09405 [Vulcanimicrobiaceae bacterium]
MENAIEAKEVAFDGYTMCSFIPELDSARAIPLVLIGYHRGEDPWFVWLVPKDGLSPQGLTGDPYYAKVLRDPHAYFVKKLNKYVEESGSVKRGIERLVDCHQNHLAFTPLVSLTEVPFAHPMAVELIAAS